MLYGLAVICSFFGFAALTDASKRGGRIQPMHVFYAILSGMAFHYFDAVRLWHAGFPDRWVPVGLGFASLAPFLGYVMFTRQGKLLKALFRLGVQVSLWLVGSLLLLVFVRTTLLQAVGTSLVLVLMITVPWWKPLQQVHKTRRRKVQEELERKRAERLARQQEEERRILKEKEEAAFEQFIEGMRR